MGSVPNSFLHGGSFLENKIFWGNQKSDSANPHLFNPYIDNEYNNNMKCKSHIWDFPLISDAENYQGDEEKENLSWIPNAIQSVTVSITNNINSTFLLTAQKLSCNEEARGGNRSRCCSNSSVSEPLMSCDGESLATKSHVDKADVWNEEAATIAGAMGHQEVPQCEVQIEEDIFATNTLAEPDDSEGIQDEENRSNAGEDKQEDDGSFVSCREDQNPDEMDTLLTFLSKFDDKVAAIWGSKRQDDIFEHIGNGNPWNTTTTPVRAPELFSFQHVEDDYQHSNCSENDLSLFGQTSKHAAPHSAHKGCKLIPPPSSLLPDVDLKGKYTIMNSMQQYFGSAPPSNEYYIIKTSNSGGTHCRLDELNHSDETSGFIKFIPLRSFKNEDELNQCSDVDSCSDENSAANIKEMLHNLDLDCEEEQEIVAACSKAKPGLAAEGPPEDLLTSWKTHFRTVIAQEVRTDNFQDVDGISPGIIQNRPILPEFRTEFDDTEYKLFQPASAKAFQVRFKLRRENEKANQTDDCFAPPEPVERIAFSDELGNFPYITHGKQLPGWWFELDDDFGQGFELDWSESQFLDSCTESFYEDSTYDEYETFRSVNENDMDYGHVNSYCCNDNLPYFCNNKQKSNRRRAKGRPCKYFFMDGSCRRGNDCKFSHDLITCRFWAEGSCLKGQACPFLHCFLNEKEYEEQNLTDSKIDTQYQLESESDFPALGSTKMSSRVPMEEVSKVNGLLSSPQETRLDKFIVHFDEQEANGWSQQQDNSSATNWICSLISVNEKRKKKKH